MGLSLRKQIEIAVLSAGQIILNAQNDRDDHIAKAGHANFVTAYDERVQEFLIERLSAILPEARFLGEEEGKDKFRDEYRTGWLFIIDPIDGTSNFMSGYFPFVTSVALLKDGEPYIGVIGNPVSGDLFSAERGGGSTRNGMPVQVSEKPLSECLASFGTSPYRSDLSEKSFRLAEALMPRCIDLRRSGAAAWDLCMVADGRTGLFAEYTLGIWDYAAGALIVTEAGGSITQISGEPLTFDGPTSILACGRGVSQDDIMRIHTYGVKNP